jgi:hypothetical protein
MPAPDYYAGQEFLVCPYDGTTCTIIGSSDFSQRCPNCARQFRLNGQQLVQSVLGVTLAWAPGVRDDRRGP